MTWRKAALHRAKLQFPAAFVTPLGSGSPSRAYTSPVAELTWLLVDVPSSSSPCAFIQKDKRQTKPWVTGELISRLPASDATSWFCLFSAFDLLFLGRRLTTRTINTWVELEITVWFHFFLKHKFVSVQSFFSQQQPTCEGCVQKKNLWEPYSKHCVVLMTCDLQTADGPAFKRPH